MGAPRVPTSLTAATVWLALTGVATACSSSTKVASTYRADSLHVDKSERLMTVFANGEVVRQYRIELGGSPVGPKRAEGDERTPEGRYTIDGRNPNSVAYRSLHISYPNSADVARANALGHPAGGMIMIHGLLNRLGWIGRAHLLYDKWTNGCIAVTNAEMDELWSGVRSGTPIHIVP